MQQPGDVRARPAVTTLDRLDADLLGLAGPDEGRCGVDDGRRAPRRAWRR